MRVAALVTGGKDSLYAVVKAVEMGHRVAYLVSMLPRSDESWMFHHVNIHLTELVSEAVGIPLVSAETSGVEGEVVEDLKRVLAGLDVEGVVSGAIASTYQKSRVDRVCSELGLEHVAPLWGREPAALLAEMIDYGLETIVTAVAALGLDESWLGRRLNHEALRDLIALNQQYGINVCGEGGEFETLVLDAPIYRRRIRIVEARRVWRGDSGFLVVENAELEDKP